MSAAFAAGIICALTATTTYAAELKTSGTATHVIVSNESHKLNDGRTILYLHDKGVVEDNDPKSPFHLALEDCFATLILGWDKGNVADGGGYCNDFDKDGDGYLLWWHFTPGGSKSRGSKWSVYHGTGKFEGMSGGGTSKTIVNFPDRYTVTYEGTLTMK
jgi:hypothetical protein